MKSVEIIIKHTQEKDCLAPSIQCIETLTDEEQRVTVDKGIPVTFTLETDGKDVTTSIHYVVTLDANISPDEVLNDDAKGFTLHFHNTQRRIKRVFPGDQVSWYLHYETSTGELLKSGSHKMTSDLQHISGGPITTSSGNIIIRPPIDE